MRASDVAIVCTGGFLNINLPNALTLLRIFLVPFLVVVLLTKFDGRETVGLLIFLTAVTTDFLDGWLARRRREITTLGALLDPIADKLLISAAFISLVELGLAPAWMVVVVIGREFAVSGLRSIASGRGIVISASVWGKAKMGTQIAAVSLLILALRHEGFALPGRIALWLVVAVALASGTEYFTRFLRRIVLTPPTAGDGA
ncbi:MAG: CDP-diacylglycerol--glycerol-3-phosphate 3-phosphatidyltransferase [Syntrophomonadaceae bacterium]